jgi:DNA-binding NarL/FixJ family response regulator
MAAKILIADDHSVVLAGLTQILRDSGHQIVGTVEDGRALVDAASAVPPPDLIILDISMPILNGIEAARQIRAANNRVKIVFLSMHSDPTYMREAFRAGGNAYLIKSSATAELPAAVQEVIAGRSYVSPRLARGVLNFASDSQNFGSDLSARQREVLQLVAEGKTAKEIAAVLNISTKTVEYHKANIMNTLGVRSIAELTRYAVRQGIATS